MFPDQNVNWQSSDSLEIYTDGSCIGNGLSNASCGWAYAIILGQEEIFFSGGWTGGTNNQAEMRAVIEALKKIKSHASNPITVYSDSRYVVETLNGNYTISKNQDLWAELKKLVNTFPHIRFLWVKGHANNRYNNIVDQMANQEATSRIQH